MTPSYSEMQLDALRELANIASGTAATALSQMLGQEVELNVPRAKHTSTGRSSRSRTAYTDTRSRKKPSGPAPGAA